MRVTTRDFMVAKRVFEHSLPQLKQVHAERRAAWIQVIRAENPAVAKALEDMMAKAGL